MATPLSTLETIVRDRLREPTASFWSSAQLISIINLGIKDLWRAVNDLKLKHFCTLDVTNVSQAASATTLTGVPADLSRVHLIEVRDLSDSSTSRNLVYRPKDYAHADFQSARALSAIDPSGGAVIWYDVIKPGAPVAAPTIQVAPKLSTAVNLSLMYVPVLGTLTAADDNPIPGESDNALVAWTVAFARADDPVDPSGRVPDPAWLAIYATEKTNLIVSLDPRQTQEAQVVEALFEQWWG
jgi:hypothetical protein